MNSVGAELVKQFPQCTSILAAICDQNGVLRGKRYPLTALDKVLYERSRLPLSLCNLDIWGLNIDLPLPDFLAGDRDGDCVWTERHPMPSNWLANEALLVPLTMNNDDGSPFLGDPRRVLESVVSRYHLVGLTPVVAVELEFYLVVVKNSQPSAPPSPLNGEALLPTSALPISELEHFNEFLDDVYRSCEAHKIRLDAAIAECGAGQFEINLVHRDKPVRAADDALYFKHLVKSVARKHGYTASFMAKPYLNQPGSGMHVHFNVLDEQGHNIFADNTSNGSQRLAHAIEGALNALVPCSLIFAPHLNSYRRFKEGSHAPTSVSWGHENRAAAIRIPGGDVEAKRIEHRVAGADANPYLVIAAILSACLQGLNARQALRVPHINGENNGLLNDWQRAHECFSTSQLVKSLLPEQFTRMFSDCKRQEITTFNNQMSSFEINSYLTNV